MIRTPHSPPRPAGQASHPLLQRPSDFLRKLLRGGGLALVLTVAPIPGHPARAAEAGEEQAVLAVVNRLFDGMREKSETSLRAVFAAEARIGTTAVDAFITNVLSSQRHLDEVTFDETVLVDGDLAMAWTPYNIFVDGVFHHCGVDLFVMRYGDNGWRITQLDDTRRSNNCDPTRRS